MNSAKPRVLRVEQVNDIPVLFTSLQVSVRPNHPCMTALKPNRVFRAARRCWAHFHQSESPHNPI